MFARKTGTEAATAPRTGQGGCLSPWSLTLITISSMLVLVLMETLDTHAMVLEEGKGQLRAIIKT